ncbi:hypothetical protein PABG_02562 [Paracoccidioides brasiliensis Pb03]|nr:hypothetical protein PABG_02562 [Paracoccidioides brasiliensis Pb03]
MSANPVLSCFQLRGPGSQGCSDRVTVRQSLLHNPRASAPPHVPVIPYFIRHRFYILTTSLCSSSWMHRLVWLVSGCVVDGELSMIHSSGPINGVARRNPSSTLHSNENQGFPETQNQRAKPWLQSPWTRSDSINLQITSSATKLQSPKLFAISTHPKPAAPACVFTSLSCPSQQLRHPLAPRLLSSVMSPISSHPASQQSQPPETPENDFDRILEKMSLDDGSQPLGGNRRNTDEHTTIPSGLNLSGFSSDRLGMPVEADTAAESATEAGLHTCRSGGSRDLSLDLLTIRVFDPLTSALFQMATSESAGGQTSPPPLPAREAPTDQGDKLDRIADDDGALLTS